MLFSSISFLYFFLPAAAGLYFLVPDRYKNALLLLASLLFYFFGEPVYCLLMIFSIASGYLHGLWISRTGKRRAVPLVSSIVFAAGTLVFFKYSDFVIENMNRFPGADIPLLDLALPLGVSFYTFQIMSYTIDLYRGSVSVQKNFIDFAAYVSMFPQLIAGPIVRYSSIESSLKCRRHTISDAAYGIRRFITGLAKKVLIANTLGELVAVFNGADEKTVLLYWSAAAAFTLQIYFDFSGYSDMAIGLGRIFGFRFPENFNYPFISRSVTEFWRRWHITLGSWFRDYVYIPLGGNRVNLLRWAVNILIVWFLTGFWHGAEWNFIAWGLYFAFFLVVEKFVLKGLMEKLPAAAGHLYLVAVVTVSFVIFNASGMDEAVTNLKGMFGMMNVPFAGTETLYHLRSYAVIMALAAILATPLVKHGLEKLNDHGAAAKALNILSPAALIMVFLAATAYLVDGSFNPFIYFRF